MSFTEGQATIQGNDQVFYNPIQEFNRDMSIAAISVFAGILLKERLDASKKSPSKKAKETPSESTSSPIQATPVDNSPKNPASNDPDSEQLNKNDLKKNQLKRALESSIQKTPFDKIDLDDPDFHGKGISIYEALSASGLRSIRYAKEIPHVKQIVANDLDENAVSAIADNVALNNVSHLVVPNQGDARLVLYQALAEEKHYDVIDLDPYGSSCQFLDAAVQAVSNGGLLCVTNTDAAVLAGAQPEACWAKYGAINVPNSPFTHELALRITLHSIQSAAARYKRYIVPVLSCSIDYYFRVFVRVFEAPVVVKQAASKSSMIYHCSGCKSFVLQPIGKFKTDGKVLKYGNAQSIVTQRCEHCNSCFHLGGPFYGPQIHDPVFIARMLDHLTTNQSYGTLERMVGMLTVMSEELANPFYFLVPSMTGVLHCVSPRKPDFVSALLNQGYQVSSSHANVQAIKTNAPHRILWDILRSWCKKNPPKPQSETSPSHIILSKEPGMEADFTKHVDAEPASLKYKLMRFQENPTPNWGPQSRPGKPVKAPQVQRPKRPYDHSSSMQDPST